MGTVSLHVAPSEEALIQSAVDRLLAVANDALRDKGEFNLALSGGSTPRPLYELLATEPLNRRIDWSRTHLFLGDERAVPPDHEDSNYRMVRETLLAGIDVPAENVHRILAERSPQDAADAYAEDLREHFDLTVGEWPRFDFMLQGLGRDGHTASLFPGLDELHDRRNLVVAPYVPSLETYRISVTFPVINHAWQICFLVSGAGKAEALQHVVGGTYAPDDWPAQFVHPRDGHLMWLVDEAAASLL